MKHITREDIRMVLLVLIGSAVNGAGFSFLTYPNSIVSGGVTGIGQIINLLTGLPVGVLVMLMNIPLFLVAWKKFGTRFIVFSLIGMLSNSLFIDLFNSLQRSLTNDMLLAAFFGGAVKGLGLGIIYYQGATTGGADIAARFLRRRYPYINFGTLSLCLDAVVVAAFTLVFRRVDSALYTVIAMFVASKVVNLILYGMSNSGVCYIVTVEPRKIAESIGSQLERGATILRGEGAYSGSERDVILCVVKRSQIPALRRIVAETDRGAFVIVTESHEVFGKNFLNIGKID